MAGVGATDAVAVTAEEHYWMLIERLPVVAYASAMDAVGATVQASTHAVEIYGHPAEALRNDPALWQRVIHKADRGRVAASYAAAVASRKTFREEYRIVRPDGTTCWVRDQCGPAIGVDGRELMHGVIIDITAEREAIEALRSAQSDLERRVEARTSALREVNEVLRREVNERRRSEAEAQVLEARYRSLVEQLPGVVYLDEVLADGEIRPAFISPRVVDLTGRSPAEMLRSQDAWQAIIHPDDRERVRRTDAEHVLAEGAHSREYRVVDSAGRVRWVLDQCRVVPPADGLPGFDQGVLIDLTEKLEAEEELRRLTDLQARILEATAEGVYGIDTAGRATFVNRAAAEILGWTQDELMGQPVHVLIHHTRLDGSAFPPEDCPIYAALHDGISHAVEDDVFWRRDLTPVSVAYRSNPILVDGAVTGAVVVFGDVSARRAAAEALRKANEELEERVAARTAELAQSEARWRSVIDSVPGSLVLVDHEGRLTFAGRTDDAGHDDELTEATLFSTVPTEHHPVIEAALAAAFERGEQATFEVPVRRADGAAAWRESRIARSADDEAVVFSVDVTERRRRQLRGHVQVQLARTLAESPGLDACAGEVLETEALALGWDRGVLWVVTDDEGRPGLRRVGDWARPDVVARTAAASASTDDGQESLAALAALAAASNRPLRWDPIRSAGLPRLDEWAATVGVRAAVGIPITAGADTLGVALFFAADLGPPDGELDALSEFGASLGQAMERWRSVEALLAARDEADRANRAKSEMLGRLSHELRTPLNAILGFGQLLEIADLDDDDRESVTEVVNAGRRLLGLIDRVLEVVRLDAGQGSMLIADLAVGEIARAVLDGARGAAHENEVDLVLEGGPPAWVRADQVRLGECLRILVANGVSHNRPGGSCSIAWSHRPDAVTIEVADTGPGIAPDRIDRIFTPFDPEGTDRKGAVAGLSLALARRQAEMMGGRLTVSSTPGEGSVFRLVLPRVAEPPAAGLRDESPERSLSAVAVLPTSAWPPLLHALRPVPGLRLAVGDSENAIRAMAHDERPSVAIVELADGDLAGRVDAVTRLSEPPPRTIVLCRQPVAGLGPPPGQVTLLDWPTDAARLADLVADHILDVGRPS